MPERMAAASHVPDRIARESDGSSEPSKAIRKYVTNRRVAGLETRLALLPQLGFPILTYVEYIKYGRNFHQIQQIPLSVSSLRLQRVRERAHAQREVADPSKPD